MIETETIIKGDLFIGEGTYIKGEWVRRHDYDSLNDLADAQRDEIAKLRAEVQLLHQKMREMMPPRVASVIERHEELDYVKCVESAHWGPDGIRIVIR